MLLEKNQSHIQYNSIIKRFKKIGNTNYSFFRVTDISINNYKANQGDD